MVRSSRLKLLPARGSIGFRSVCLREGFTGGPVPVTGFTRKPAVCDGLHRLEGCVPRKGACPRDPVPEPAVTGVVTDDRASAPDPHRMISARLPKVGDVILRSSQLKLLPVRRSIGFRGVRLSEAFTGRAGSVTAFTRKSRGCDGLHRIGARGPPRMAFPVASPARLARSCCHARRPSRRGPCASAPRNSSTMASADPLLRPYRLKHLTLKNGSSTAHEPAYSEDGMPKDWRLLPRRRRAGSP